MTCVQVGSGFPAKGIGHKESAQGRSHTTPSKTTAGNSCPYFIGTEREKQSEKTEEFVSIERERENTLNNRKIEIYSLLETSRHYQ